MDKETNLSAVSQQHLNTLIENGITYNDVISSPMYAELGNSDQATRELLAGLKAYEANNMAGNNTNFNLSSGSLGIGASAVQPAPTFQDLIMGRATSDQYFSIGNPQSRNNFSIGNPNAPYTGSETVTSFMDYGSNDSFANNIPSITGQNINDITLDADAAFGYQSKANNYDFAAQAGIDNQNATYTLAQKTAYANALNNEKALENQAAQLSLNKKLTPYKIAGSVFDIGAGLYSLYQGNKQLKLGEKNFKLNKDISLANLRNQTALTNEQIRDRGAMRARSRGLSLEDATAAGNAEVNRIGLRGA